MKTVFNEFLSTNVYIPLLFNECSLYTNFLFTYLKTYVIIFEFS